MTNYRLANLVSDDGEKKEPVIFHEWIKDSKDGSLKIYGLVERCGGKCILVPMRNLEFSYNRYLFDKVPKEESDDND